jgi:Domain of unknown function (DUF4281)
MAQYEFIFSASYLWTMLFWALLILGPRTGFTEKIVLLGGILPLVSSYTILLALTMTGHLSLGEKMVGSPDPTNLAGAMAFLGSEGGATMGWIHFLALDLLAGLWMARISDQNSIHRVAQSLILLSVFVAAPVGLVLFLIVLAIRKRQSKRVSGAD